MSDRIYNVLFVCTHNSARSIMAEGLLNSIGRGKFKAYSAGSQPAGKVNTYAVDTMSRLHLPTDGLRSKDWAEFAGPDPRRSTSSSRCVTTLPARSALCGPVSR